jgi:uncharacterized Zn finger protein (UPF0148 family)
MAESSPIQKVTCPECGAVLKTKSPRGFKVDDSLECPKCQTYFAVEEPNPGPNDRPKPVKKAVAAVIADDDDDDDDRPRKKRKKRARDDEETSGYVKYRRSPLRFIILGVLVAVMIVMAVLLWFKWENQKKADKEFESSRPALRITRLGA